MIDHAKRLAEYTPRWRMYVRVKNRSAPFDAHEPVELRALTEELAGDLLASWMPHLELLTDQHGNPCISRQS